eukprot:502008-Rhodomonas_salina.4
MLRIKVNDEKSELPLRLPQQRSSSFSTLSTLTLPRVESLHASVTALSGKDTSRCRTRTRDADEDDDDDDEVEDEDADEDEDEGNEDVIITKIMSTATTTTTTTTMTMMVVTMAVTMTMPMAAVGWRGRGPTEHKLPASLSGHEHETLMTVAQVGRRAPTP